MPFNGFSTITSYKLEIESSSFGLYAEYDCQLGLDNNSCEVPMQDLLRHPFNLKAGDEI